MEELADRSAERLAPAEVINLVVAWRALLMTLLVRDHPDLLPEVTFSKLETMVLMA